MPDLKNLFFKAININELVKESLNLLAAKLKNSGIRRGISLSDEQPPVEGDPKQLSQVFLNLLLNAVEAMPGGGTLTIRSPSRKSGQRPGVPATDCQGLGTGFRRKIAPICLIPFLRQRREEQAWGFPWSIPLFRNIKAGLKWRAKWERVLLSFCRFPFKRRRNGENSHRRRRSQFMPFFSEGANPAGIPDHHLP